MAEKNGNVKWWQLITLLVTVSGILVGVLQWRVNEVSAVEQRSLDRDSNINKCIYEHIISMKESIVKLSGTIDKMELLLSRLEKQLSNKQ